MSSREDQLIDRVEMALLLNFANRTLHEGACREAARAALDKVKARKQYYGGSRKKRVYEEVTEALRVVK